ncbi:nitroreductase family deazaflavin-dependent oxidoreductase [Ornithinicoccus hortensis]|uniref:Deazaflavin-dependent oxidoreductase (Nitroreductase family) n=1 Tax=Ornithinicoccus hortensis TaxID=82346 RepID=A0A542YT63_9MICO|nr:nitroreductase family deazaflavin-dependent oxidoreductase [Ornithinicoccus hortensis]TQL51247.1 deazaflavin-dependent oxidoreductase (nitroreductase family) [Ornithinicoccus hortensis]
MSSRSARSLGARLLQTRAFARAPVPAFRVGLGFLFTRRLLMLEHVGRSTGAARYVVLEVVEDSGTGSLVVASGFGPRAQWFRNLVAQPRCHVSTGLRRRVPALATVLDPAESAAVLARYQVEHPAAWEKLSAIITEATGCADPQIPLVRLSLER